MGRRRQRLRLLLETESALTLFYVQSTPILGFHCPCTQRELEHSLSDRRYREGKDQLPTVLGLDYALVPTVAAPTGIVWGVWGVE
jgi:hypothetical protein